MGVSTSEVGYTPAMPTREDYEVHKGHVVALGKRKTMTARKGFWKSLSLQRFHFALILLQKHIRDSSVSSELPFHRFIVAKRQRVGVSRSLP